MLIKTLTLHSLTYLVGLTSSLAVHQNGPWSPVADRADIPQIVLRTAKSDRLPIRRAMPRALGSSPAVSPASTGPGLKIRDACTPPIDVRGRCFAGADFNQHQAV